MPVFRVEELLGTEGIVRLPPELAGDAGRVPEVVLELGTARAHARLESDHVHVAGRVGLSGDLIHQLRLPLDVPWCVQVERRRIRLGPLAAILAGARLADLTPIRLTAMLNHLTGQKDRGGLVVVCAREGLDLARKEMQGLRLTAAGRWHPGVFPLPGAVFRRYGTTLGDRLEALQELGIRVFNERIFHKWEAWQWMAADSRVRPHVPDTERCQKPAGVLAMLQKHPAVYVKPVWGSLGEQVMRVRRDGRGYTVDGAGDERLAAVDDAALAEIIRPRLPGYAIVQQGLELATAGERLVDFRVILQKDGHGDWTVTGLVGRCGTPALHLSNMATGGFPLPVEDGMALLFGSSPTVLFRRKEELGALALAVGEALDRGGLLLGDLGLDIAYDVTGHPWVIEANNRDPDHNIGWEAGSWPLFHAFRTRPVEYVRHLAGFGREEGGAAR